MNSNFSDFRLSYFNYPPASIWNVRISSPYASLYYRGDTKFESITERIAKRYNCIHKFAAGFSKCNYELNGEKKNKRKVKWNEINQGVTRLIYIAFYSIIHSIHYTHITLAPAVMTKLMTEIHETCHNLKRSVHNSSPAYANCDRFNRTCAWKEINYLCLDRMDAHLPVVYGKHRGIRVN